VYIHVFEENFLLFIIISQTPASMVGMLRRTGFLLTAVLVSSTACTPGAPTAPNGSVRSGSVVIHASFGKFIVQSQYGLLSSYSPNPLVVSRGAVVQFVNDDNFDHTATSLGTNGFPQSGPGGKAQSRSGNDLAQPDWSSGVLTGGAVSQTFNASTPGTYYYGCFFHYGTPGSPMRGVIVVQ
jgi:plastocyanin